jgi:glycosyltransferase involved in cell wall biosynthesis
MALMSAEVMADAGLPVTFVTADDGADCPLDRNRIEVVALGENWSDDSVKAGAVARALYNPRARRLLETLIARHDTPGTVYHLHNWTKLLSPSIFQALRRVSSRLVMTAHDFALVCPNLAYSNYQRGGEACSLTPLSGACLATQCDRESYLHKLWRVARTLERRMFLDLKDTRALVTIIHPDMIEYFTRGGIDADRIRVVRNPVNAYAPERIAVEDNSDLFFVGRVVHEKGVDLAAEAARLAGRRLRVIGDGAARASLAQRYPELVFEGWRNHAQISELMREARAVLVPSRLPETFTLVAHEAMRAGIPVIAFEDVDCREAAALGAAITVPPREASSLAEAVRRLDDRAAILDMSLKAVLHAPKFSNTRGSWRDAVLDLYAELIAARSDFRLGIGDREVVESEPVAAASRAAQTATA